MSIRDRFYQKLQESREQLDELRKPKDIDKLRKHMGDAAQAASDDAYKKGGDHYDETARKRKKAISTKSPQDMDDATAEQKKMSDAWKRSIAFGKIADRKKKLEEAKVNKPARSEHSWPTKVNSKGKWSWANSFKGGHASAKDADDHAKMMMKKGKKTTVSLSDLKPGSK